MKRREMDGLCRSTCEYLISRNNDINGYWGIGVLCDQAIRAGRFKLGFRLFAGCPIKIFGCNL